MSAPTRPALRWHGGKWLLAPWIISHLPPHRVYVEPFGGAASVLLRKGRSYAEIYNDLDSELVNFFQVLRSADKDRFVAMIWATPFSREDFERAHGIFEDPTSRAWCLVVRCFMGFGTNAHGYKSGFRANSNRSGTTPAHDWCNLPPNILAVAERFRGVIVESRPAIEVMAQHDGPETCHYVDPPYLPDTRDKGADYKHEMNEQQHEELLAFLCDLQGAVVLSAYPSKLYEARLAGWRKIERSSLADGARPRVEVLWLNPAAKGSPGLL